MFVDKLPGLVGGLAITPDWLHVDLFFHSLADFDRHEYDGVRVLFDRASLFPDGDQPREGGRPGTPYWPEGAVNLFIYFLGNLVTVLGRDERVVANQGVGALRDLLIVLMLAERGVHRTGGAKRLNAYLSPEQRLCLEQIPAVGSTRAEILAANQYLVREFLRRAKSLASQTGSSWPSDFVAATLSHLHNHLEVRFG